MSNSRGNCNLNENAINNNKASRKPDWSKARGSIASGKSAGVSQQLDTLQDSSFVTSKNQ